MRSVGDLGRSDLVLLLEFVDQSRTIASESDVTSILRRLCDQVPARGVIAVASPSRLFDLTQTADTPSRPKFQTGSEGRIVTAGGLSFLNVGYPEPWLAEYWDKNYFVSDPTKSALQRGAQLLPWADTFAKPEQLPAKRYVRAAFDFGIRDGVTVAVRPPHNRPRCYFSFLGDQLSQNGRAQTMLRYLTPYMQEAMCASISGPPAVVPLSQPRLPSVREIEVLQWTAEGKTNWEISIILRVSERTVKFHLANAMAKLQATSRAHAVAIALRHSVISL